MATQAVCSKIYDLPDLSNVCNSMGDTKVVTNWVSSATPNLQGTQEGPAPTFVNDFNSACGLIGEEGEWVWSGQPPVKMTDFIASNANPMVSINVPVMVPTSDLEGNEDCFKGNGYLENAYSNLVCTRSKFTGDPLTCCLNNQACSGSCYSDSENKNTCAPELRDQYSSGCESFMIDFCSGNADSSYYTSNSNQFNKPWMNEWVESGTCLTYFRNKLFNNSNNCIPNNPQGLMIGACNYDYSPAVYNAEGVFTTSVLMNQVFRKYSEEYDLGAPVGSSNYNTFENYLFETVCCPYSGVCDAALNNQCADKTIDDLVESNSLSLWCGCHMSDSYYDNYGIAYNLPKACTPMCSKQGVILNGDLATGTAETCTDNVCLISKTTIDLAGDNINNIQFEQLCSTCTGSNCSCIIEGNTIDITNSTIDGTLIPISSGCNNLTCNMQQGGNTVSNNCVDTDTGLQDYYSKYETIFGIYNLNSLLLNLGIGLLLLFVVFVIIIVLIPTVKYFKNRNSE